MRRATMRRLLIALAGCLILVPTYAGPSDAGDGTVRMTRKGLDRCQAPTHEKMRDFYFGTQWYWWGVYIGGSNMACENDNVTADWVRTELNRGWKLLFIWVGPQAPCTGYNDTMSSNPDVAYEQGQNVAANAYTRAIAPGSAGGLSLNADFPIVYDLEAFNTGNDTCLRAAKAFLRGWVSYFHVDPAQSAGVYGSSCGSGVCEYWSSTANPDFLW